MPLHTPIKEEIIEQIKKVIEARNDCELTLRESFGTTYWLMDKEGTNEFRISSLGKYRVTISRVCFKNRRCGTMTAIVDILINYCQREGISEILIQSVETPEMMAFCLKSGFVPSEWNIPTEDVLLGDYILKI